MKKVFLTILICFALLNCYAKGSIKVTDYAGRTVTLAKPAEKVIVMADNSFMIVKQLGAINTVVGVDSKTKGYWNLYLVSKTNPEYSTLPDVGKAKNPNYEYIISLNPDLILFKGNKEAADNLELKTNTPVASIISKNGFDFEIYNLIGTLLGKEKEAVKIINKLSSEKKFLETKLGVLSASQKKSAYIVVQNSKNNMFKTIKNNNSLELASVLNVASSSSKVDDWGFAEVSKEEFINMDPDTIYIDYPVSEKSINKDAVCNDETFQFSTAVKNKSIFLTHSFSAPKDYAFVISEAYYYARNAYPDLISEQEYKKAVNDIFETTYKIKNYFDDWEKSLN